MLDITVMVHRPWKAGWAEPQGRVYRRCRPFHSRGINPIRGFVGHFEFKLFAA